MRSVRRLYYTCHFRANGATSASCSRHTFYRGTDRSRRSNGGPQRDEQRIITCIGAIEAKIQDTKYISIIGYKNGKEKGGREVGWRGAPVTAGAWRLRAVATHALGIPSLARGGKLSQTSDRLYSCGFPDRQSRPWSATGAGGFEVLIANCKLQF